MTAFHWILVGYAALGLAYWIAQLALIVRAVRAMPVLSEITPPEPAKWPKLSVIMPGRNEEDKVEPALCSRLSDDYPDLELIMVEDRSTDGTPEIVDRVAQEHPRLQVVHIQELPEGWIGKCYAMHIGAQAATGDWLLFSDADVHVSAGTMRKAIAYAESRQLDHLSLFPEIWQQQNPLVNLAMCDFVRIILIASRIWEVENPEKETGMGAGAFNLVRRSAFLRTPGFEWLKMEVADDAAFGTMMKRSGAKCSCANGSGLVGVHFQRSLKELLTSAERAGFTNIGNFSLSRMLLMALVVVLLDGSPIITLIPSEVPLVTGAGVVMLILSILVHMVGNASMKRPLDEPFLWFLATPINVYALVRAGVLGKLRKGIVWRGTFYPTEKLREGRRFRL